METTEIKRREEKKNKIKHYIQEHWSSEEEERGERINKIQQQTKKKGAV